MRIVPSSGSGWKKTGCGPVNPPRIRALSPVVNISIGFACRAHYHAGMNSLGPSAAKRDVYSVARVNREARRLLETGLPMLWVSGEISNLAMPASGHWYFTL
ncbi:MAG: exodeoxyribonuclease VII large subunit, partial [Gammaproteobacteria bacterium]